MIRLIGLLLVALCGTAVGMSAAERIMFRYRSVSKVYEMFLQLEILMQYGCLTVPKLLSGLRSCGAKMPAFIEDLDSTPDTGQVLELIEKNTDELDQTDMQKLKEFFTGLGSADKQSELSRIASAREYFRLRNEEESRKSKTQARLARQLGVLAGLFIMVLFI